MLASEVSAEGVSASDILNSSYDVQDGKWKIVVEDHYGDLPAADADIFL